MELFCCITNFGPKRCSSYLHLCRFVGLGRCHLSSVVWWEHQIGFVLFSLS